MKKPPTAAWGSAERPHTPDASNPLLEAARGVFTGISGCVQIQGSDQIEDLFIGRDIGHRMAVMQRTEACRNRSISICAGFRPSLKILHSWPLCFRTVWRDRAARQTQIFFSQYFRKDTGILRPDDEDSVSSSAKR